MTDPVTILILVTRCKIPSLEKDRVGVPTAIAVAVLKMCRLETIAVMGEVYAKNVNTTSRIKPVLKELQMILTLTDTATTVCKEKPIEWYHRKRGKSKKKMENQKTNQGEP